MNRFSIMGIIIFICIVLALFNSSSFFLALMVKPQQTVYLGTIHYYEDYFLYLNHFFQGAHGAWLVANRYTSEYTHPSILYWSNLFLGKIGALFQVPIILSYNVSVILLSFIDLYIGYILITRIHTFNRLKILSSFLFFSLSTSFINHIYVNNAWMWYPFQLWKTPHYAFDRLGGAPHQLLQSILFFLGILFFYTPSNQSKKIAFASFISFVMLASINPIQAGMGIACMWIIFIGKYSEQKHSLPLLLGITAAAGMVALYVNSILSTQPHLQTKIWEALQSTQTTVPFLLASIGPISLFFLLGVWPSIKTRQTTLWLSILLPIACYGIFLSPLPKLLGVANVRFIFPSLYSFLAIIATEGVWALASIFRKKTQSIAICITILAIIISLPTLIIEMEEKIKPLQNPRDIVLFMPTPMYVGLHMLTTQLPFDDIVLASGITHFDVVIPPLTGHTTYAGHILATTENERKKAESSQLFFMQYSPQVALDWIKKNSIRYVVYTRLDGDAAQFRKQYPFLSVWYSNADITIFKPDT